jgi:hypothetical protein
MLPTGWLFLSLPFPYSFLFFLFFLFSLIPSPPFSPIAPLNFHNLSSSTLTSLSLHWPTTPRIPFLNITLHHPHRS